MVPGTQYMNVAVIQSLSHVQLFVTHGLQHIRLPCPSLSPGNSLKVLSWWLPSPFLCNVIVSEPRPRPFKTHTHTHTHTQASLLVLWLADIFSSQGLCTGWPVPRPRPIPTWSTLFLSDCSCHLLNEACPDHPILNYNMYLYPGLLIFFTLWEFFGNFKF